MQKIKFYHAHFYYTEETLDIAKSCIEKAGKELPVDLGHMHERNVGPHPMWSCQLLFEGENFQEVMEWLMLNRKGLTVFIHPVTGDDLIDHTEYTIWMGKQVELDLSDF